MIGSAALGITLGVPLLAALLTALPGNHGQPLARASGVVTLIAALTVAAVVAGHGSLVIDAGNWAPPAGIRLRADGLASVLLVITALTLLAILLATRHAQIRAATGPRQAQLIWPLLLLAWGAINAILVSNDLFNVFVGLELLTLAAIALVALNGRAAALRAAIGYLLVALSGSLLYLLGVVLLYSAHGTLDLGLLAGQLSTHDAVALGAITVGLAAKTALFPFHGWLPPAHGEAPSPASALLSALVTKASFVMLIRIWFDVAPTLLTDIAALALGLLGATAMLYGSLLALRQQRLKQVIAYSTVAQIGYLFLLFPLLHNASPGTADAAWVGTLLHAIAHALAKASLFLCAGLVIIGVGHDRLPGLRGLVRSQPLTVFAFALGAIVLMGLPPTLGFSAKYLMMTAAFSAGQPGWALLLVVAGLLAAAYLYRPLALAFSSASAATHSKVPWQQQFPALLLALTATLLGLASGLVETQLQIGWTAPGGGVQR